MSVSFGNLIICKVAQNTHDKVITRCQRRVERLPFVVHFAVCVDLFWGIWLLASDMP